MIRSRKTKMILSVCLVGLLGCHTNEPPYPGPDKQGEGLLRGMATGAGVGAITAAQLTAATGPGAFIGAGFGAVAGSITGAFQDRIEEEQMDIAEKTERQREITMMHELIKEHYERRMALHPTRDIFPADVFFRGDDTRLTRFSESLVKEIGRQSKNRLPWSRLRVITYSRARDENSEYARHLSEERSKSITNALVMAGLEPRRVQPVGVVMDVPILIDPQDDPMRYNQAVEFALIDR